MFEIFRYVNPDAQLFEKATGAIKEVANKFPLTKNESSDKSRRQWGQAFDDEGLTYRLLLLFLTLFYSVKLESYVPDPSAKKRKIEGQGDFSLEKLVSIGTNDVGSINPVQDFKDMLARRDVDLVEKAVEPICHCNNELYFFDSN